MPHISFLNSKVFLKLLRKVVSGVFSPFAVLNCTTGVVPGLKTCKQRKLLYLASFNHYYNFYSVFLGLLHSFFPPHTPQTISLLTLNVTEISLGPWESDPIYLGHPPLLGAA